MSPARTKVEVRPLTAAEKKLLKSYLKHRSGGVGDFLITWLIGGGLMAIGAMFLCALVPFLRPYAIAVTGLTIVGSGIYYLRSTIARRRNSTQGRSDIREDLERGEAETTVYEVNEFIALEEFEDEGTGYFINVGSGEVLFLQGQNLDDLAAERRFPCARFRLARSPRAQIPLHLECLGEYLAPLGQRRPFTKDDFKKDNVPAHGDLLKIDFQELKRDLVPA